MRFGLIKRSRNLLTWLFLLAGFGLLAIPDAGSLFSMVNLPRLFLAGAFRWGVVRGIVLDDECNCPLPYADVDVRGTSSHASSDSLGRFTIKGVPLGYHTIQAYNFADWSSRKLGNSYSISKKHVVVLPLHPRTLSIRLKLLRSPKREAIGDANASGETCDIHGPPMWKAFVPIEFGLPVSRPDYDRVSRENFPNAAPWVHGVCVVSKPDYAWAPRCLRCVYARNAYISGSYWGDQSRLPRSEWPEYRLEGVFFRAPAGAMENVQDECGGHTGSWTNIQPSIQVYTGHRNERLAIGQRHDPDDAIGWIVDHVYGEVWRAGSGEHENLVGRFPLPRSSDWLLISISLDDTTSMGQAWAVMNSIRFES